jgi:hypothetical protein
MKKFFDLATTTALILALAGAAKHFEVNRQIGDFVKEVAVKFAPWVNQVIYS